MVTSYYMVKLWSNKIIIDFENHYNDVFDQFRYNKIINTNTKLCRVCLRNGVISIHKTQCSSDIIEALHTFGDVDVKESDEYPKYLCNFCYKFIKSAISFRKVAKQTDYVLQQPVKEESDHTYVSLGSSDDLDSKDTPVGAKAPDIIEIATKSDTEEKINVSKKVQCDVCSKLVTRSYYKVHRTMHDPNHYKYVCDVCGKSFRLRSAYHSHSLRHRNDFRYKCQLCPYKGRCAELLKTHMKIHGDKRYLCTECPARFLFRCNLNSHMRKHKEPQYKCNSCKRAFHTRILLKRHFDADHLGIKNNICNICGKAFGYKDAMNKHQRQVHKREKLPFGRMPSYLRAEHGSQ